MSKTDAVVAFKVHGDLSWAGAECAHAAHTSSTANSNTVYFYIAYIYHFMGIFFSTIFFVCVNNSPGSLG